RASRTSLLPPAGAWRRAGSIARRPPGTTRRLRARPGQRYSGLGAPWRRASRAIHRYPVGEVCAQSRIRFPRHGFVEPDRRGEKVVVRLTDRDRTWRRGINEPHLILLGEAEVDEKFGIVNFHVERLGLRRRLERKREMQRQHGLFRIVFEIVVDRI